MSPAAPPSPPAGPVAVSVRNLVKTFDLGGQPVRALRGVDFEARSGEVVMLMGPSGSGKTTLLSIMGCIMRPTSGQVAVAGEDVSGFRESRLARIRLAHIGFVFQGYNLFPTLTALENVLVALDLRGVRGDQARERAAASLAAVGLADKLPAYPANLSGGQRQRLAIARSLAGEPEIILADEPTAALDSTTGRQIMDVLRELALARRRAVVIVTHDNRILDFADRIVRIEDGRIAAAGEVPTPAPAA